MKILLVVYDNDSHISYFPLGTAYIASACRNAGHDVKIFSQDVYHWPEADLTNLLDHERFDLVGIGTIGGYYQYAKLLKLSEAINGSKQRPFYVIGGHGPSPEPGYFLKKTGADAVVIGEGEETIKELLRAIEGKQDVSEIKGIAYLKDEKPFYTLKREPIADFNKLPLPDFSLVRYAKVKIYPVGRIRGCGMDCEFCTVKGKPRCASPERLLEQISFLLETNDARHFFIVDDLFGQQREETLRFCNMLRDYQKNTGRRLDVAVQIRLDKAKDTELLSAMRQASINTVAIGFESPIEEELTAMNKHLRPEDMIALARIFHKFGFLIHGMFIFGYPLKEGVDFKMSAKERIKRFKSFIYRSKIDTIQILLPGPLPGTELRRRLVRQNRVYPLEDVGWEYYDGNFPLFEPDEPLTAEEMQASIRKIMGKFYQFKYMFIIGLHIFSFPALIFFLHNIQLGWRKWYRPWRNNLVRFGGWIIMKQWISQFRKDNFSQRLQRAKEHLRTKAK